MYVCLSCTLCVEISGHLKYYTSEHGKDKRERERETEDSHQYEGEEEEEEGRRRKI